jgi:hypothetical protein
MELGKVVINPPHCFFLEDATGFVGCNTITVECYSYIKHSFEHIVIIKFSISLIPEARPQVLLKNRTGC